MELRWTSEKLLSQVRVSWISWTNIRMEDLEVPSVSIVDRRCTKRGISQKRPS
jgi:hypothetical protein